MLHGLEHEFEESLALHALRQLKEVSRVEHVMEILSYVVSFGSFAVFIWVSKCAVASPSFRPEASRLTRLVYACVTEPEAYSSARSKQTKPGGGAERPETFGRNALRLAFCTVGIQVSYLLWGLMQERIMTRPYATGELFKSSKFLVFANRFLALLVAYAGVLLCSDNSRCGRPAPAVQAADRPRQTEARGSLRHDLNEASREPAGRGPSQLVFCIGVLVSRRQLGPSSTDHSAPLYK